MSWWENYSAVSFFHALPAVFFFLVLFANLKTHMQFYQSMYGKTFHSVISGCNPVTSELSRMMMNVCNWWKQETAGLFRLPLWPWSLEKQAWDPGNEGHTDKNSVDSVIICVRAFLLVYETGIAQRDCFRIVGEIWEHQSFFSCCTVGLLNCRYSKIIPASQRVHQEYSQMVAKIRKETEKHILWSCFSFLLSSPICLINLLLLLLSVNTNSTLPQLLY